MIATGQSADPLVRLSAYPPIRLIILQSPKPEPIVRRNQIFLLALLLAACGSGAETGTVLTFPGSALGAEGQLLERQLARFHELHPGITVVRRATPDAADERHQLYVQWLNAHASEPDILQLDVIWTPEFAAAGWLFPLERFRPPPDDFFQAPFEANRWRGVVYAMPWFVDVGMLYWRTDIFPRAPRSFDELVRFARDARIRGATPYGLVWQGARYEGLVTVFLEHLHGFGGSILAGDGHVALDSGGSFAALRFMLDAIYGDSIVPQVVLTWQEEQTRFAFQNGQAAFMRNWPYAFPLMQDTANSRVAGKFAVAPMPAAPGGRSTAALGGSQLAINRYTRHPEAAWLLIDFLTRPEQMRERARVTGQYPARQSLYTGNALDSALAIPPADARRIIERAQPRPATPVYSELSQILQVWLHRALTRQINPDTALVHAAAEIRRLLARAGLDQAPRAP